AGPVLLALMASVAGLHATDPSLRSILPLGGKAGSDVEVSFGGDRLEDTQEILSYEPGLDVVRLNLVTNKVVKAEIRIAPDCPPGEHHLRLRTATGLSDLRTFFVGPVPVLHEIEPNNTTKKAQILPINTTVEGMITSEDVDCFCVQAKKGERLSAEVEAIRTGRSTFDGRLLAYGPDGKLVADVDDTWLALQDPFMSFIAKEEGRYTFELREVTYGGSSSSFYRMHVGNFPRPTIVFPLGGKAGDRTQFTFFSPATGSFGQAIHLPDTVEEKYGIFAKLDGLQAPTPNWIRVSPFPNVLSTGANLDQKHSMAVTLDPPFALNGILSRAKQENWFSVPLRKRQPILFEVFARRLRSPLDSVIEVFDPTGKRLESNDDGAGPDSVLKFTPAETTNYLARISDSLGRGGPDFAYRIEVTETEPAITVKIPEVARNDTQSRQYIEVPRGNRFATLISARRLNFSGPLRFDLPGLPRGVKMLADEMSPGMDSMPLVFEADADAPLAGKLLTLTAAGTNSHGEVTGHFRQDVELVQGPPNNAAYYDTSVDQLCVAVTKEAPFKLRIAEPRAPLVQSGTMRLEIIADRQKGFDEPIDLKMVWNPPGISSQSEATIPRGATNVFYQMNAAASAETRVWKIAVLGHAPVGDGPLYVSSQLADLEVAPAFLSGKIETAWVNPGATAKMTVHLRQERPFDGKAKIRLMGLPETVTAESMEISKDDTEVIFELKAKPECRVGSQRNLFCAMEIPDNGTIISQTMASGGILRIVPPKKTTVKVAAAKGIR
ncbi:MAG TPA: hypothetical protein VHH88_10315, partial [Verrucomicrobiae bacterium]|nr:hypothetical protein [Verrucomicrobiae bacterium]